LYERYQREVYRLALRYAGGRVGWAEDITQDVFVKLLSDPQDLSDPEALGGWFYRVTTNRCLNRLRHEAFANSPAVRWLLRALQPPPKTPELQVLVRAELGAVAQALQHLAPTERVVFCMLHLDGKPQHEIARTLGLSKGYVSKLLARASARLQAGGWELGHE
jgi:RNA polymerase sigma-70 factor, ECF subfamily